jgi:hypothetical protein
MNEIFSKETILKTYLDLKNQKFLDRKKKLPIGLDGVGSETFEKNLGHSINEIHRKLLPREGKIPYTFAPLLRILRNKAEGGVRMLHIPRLRDQIVLRLIHNEITSHLQLNAVGIGLKSPYAYVREFDLHMKDKSNAFVIKSDIAQFYDSIPRNLAIANCRNYGIRTEIIQLLENWSESLKIRNGFTQGSGEIIDFKGLPQGISISSLLAELYAMQIDADFNTDTGYFRYVDDIAIVCDDLVQSKAKLDKLRSTVKNLGLHLSPSKTEIVKFENGLHWLGLMHYPEKKFINPEKIVQTFKPVASIQKACAVKLQQCGDKSQKIAVISEMIKEVDKFISGRNKVRLRWYSLCEDDGQWRQTDKFIHGPIRSCIRKAGLDEKDLPSLPSVHAKVISYKKQGSHTQMPIKGNAPSVE